MTFFFFVLTEVFHEEKKHNSCNQDRARVLRCIFRLIGLPKGLKFSKRGSMAALTAAPLTKFLDL